jgi:hypothetical protein
MKFKKTLLTVHGNQVSFSWCIALIQRRNLKVSLAHWIVKHGVKAGTAFNGVVYTRKTLPIKFYQ